jgi:predicted HicB family RNase H-like nuclease
MKLFSKSAEMISYEGKNVMELSEQFREAVDEYSSICEQQ